STVRRISSSRAWVSAMMVTSAGISFCSMRSRNVWKSVSDADGNPTSISLMPTAHSVRNSRFLVSRLMGSNSAWLPSRKSVLHHTGTLLSLREGHCRLGRSMGGNGRYFLEGSFNMAASLWLALTGQGRDFSALVRGHRVSSLVGADWWRVGSCG